MELVNEIGLLFIGLVGFSVLILLLILCSVLAKHSEKIKQIISGILQKLMWGSVIRCLLQGYLVIALTSLQSTTIFTDLDIFAQMTSLLMIFVTLSAPVLAIYFFIK